MEESSDGVRDCCRHIECDSVRVVVPRQSDACVLRAGEIDCNDVLQLKDVLLMRSSRLALPVYFMPKSSTTRVNDARYG